MGELLRKEHKVDVCIVGGCLAGTFAAIAATRHGAKVVLMQDRPMLGGNASSEIRMLVCGADENGHKSHLTESGILHEILLKNKSHNPYFFTPLGTKFCMKR